MAVLGADDLRTSEEFYSVIEETLACAECNSNIGQGELSIHVYEQCSCGALSLDECKITVVGTVITLLYSYLWIKFPRF